nr:Mrp/NBP35 family ATP-binding protein [Muribaculaceae bacterium]
ELYMHQVDGRNLIIPLERYGVKLLSIGFLVDKDAPVLWRGSMASNALKQLITDADWGELDYFVIDMPPGTSDIHLTLVQTLAITGVVIVSTPQEVALADARKGIAMFTGDKVNVPILGIVENMAWFTPAQHPDEKYYIFGQGGAARLAKEMDVRLLAQIPLVMSVGQAGDSGTPIAMEESVASHEFIHLAREVADAVAERNSTLPPTLKVEMKK